MGCLCSCLQDDSEGDDRAPLLNSVVPRRNFQSVQEVEGAPIGKKWYHGGISDDEAEFRLKSVAETNGDYLVYDSSRRGEYILLVFYDRRCLRWRISRRRDGRYIVGRDVPGVESYESVRMLIKHHRGLMNSKPLKLEHGGTVKLANYAFVPENEGSSKWKSLGV